jgi:hypothetical protein
MQLWKVKVERRLSRSIGRTQNGRGGGVEIGRELRNIAFDIQKPELETAASGKSLIPLTVPPIDSINR